MPNSALARSRSDRGAPLHRAVLRHPHDGNESAARGYTPRKIAYFAHYTARPLSLVAPAMFGILLAGRTTCIKAHSVIHASDVIRRSHSKEGQVCNEEIDLSEIATG
jgi:hypothetical protein